jgi:mycoredoxin
MADKIIIYSTDWCGDCRRAKRFFDEHGIIYENVNIDENPEGEQIVRKLNNGNRSVPTIVFPDGTILVEPSNVQLAEKLGTKMTVT